MNDDTLEAHALISNEKKAGEAIRLLLVDDHARVRQGLRSFLATYPDLEVVGEAASGEDALQSVKLLSPSVVLMDINMPGLNGIDATVRIKHMDPHVVVLGLLVNVKEDHRRAMMLAGASAVIAKEAVVEQLYDEIIKRSRASL